MGDSEFPSLKPTKLRKILERKLGYRFEPGSKQSGGSHCYLVAEGRGRIRWAFHKSKTSIPPRTIKSVLVDQVGLTVEEAKEVLGIG